MSAQPESSASHSSARPSQPAGAGGIRGGFPRSSKLLRHDDFQRVYQQGRRQFAPHMTVFYLERTQGRPRVGLTVGRVLGGAVERNRIRRRVREAVRAGLSALTVPVDIVINPKKSVLTLEFAVLRQEVGRALAMVQEKAVASPESRGPSQPPRDFRPETRNPDTNSSRRKQ